MALLVEAREPVCVRELADALGLPEYKVSRHLAALRPFLVADPEDLKRLRVRMKRRKRGLCVPEGGKE